jgi:hypothetical protein
MTADATQAKSTTGAGIACIGWGSLVWDPQQLPHRGPWHADGPLLPLEFARQSEAGHITLVISPDSPRVRTYWTILDVPSMEAAKQALGLREYRKADAGWIKRNIGFVDRAAQTSFGLESETISRWASSLDLAGAVWTNLPCKFNGKNNVMPTVHQVVAHLVALKGDSRNKAEAYVRNAPAQIETPYRRRIQSKLGWLPAKS